MKIDESVLPRGDYSYILEYIGAVSYKKRFIYTLLSVIRKDKYTKLDLYENDKYKIVNRNISKQEDRKIYQMEWGQEVWFYNIDQVLKEIDNEEIRSIIKNRHVDKSPKYCAMYARNGELLRVHRIRELLYNGEYLK